MVHVEGGTWDGLGAATKRFWTERMEQVALPPVLADSDAQISLEDFDPRDLSNLVTHDPVLAAKLLAVANSARFGLTAPVTSVQRAIVHLGFNLVKTILVAYQLEGVFGKFSAIPREYLQFVRRWAAGASVIALHWSQAADMPDSSSTGTLALLSRLGVLLLGMAQPAPDEEYRLFTAESSRLAYETMAWETDNPALAAQLAQHWGLPEPVPQLLRRQAEPWQDEMPGSPERDRLAICAASVALARARLFDDQVTGKLLDGPEFEQLKLNLVLSGLLNYFPAVWASAKLQRELGAAQE
jgi:HD-like signal output (HDOD) protein